MSRERELLERIVTAWEDDRYELIDALYPIIDDVRKLLESEKQDQPEPVAWMLISRVGSRHYHMSEQQALKELQMYGGKVIALYDHPAPRPEFVRLSEEEVSEILSSVHTPYEAICAVENRLVEKNRG